METTLHKELKRSYAASEAETEVTLGGFRIDAVRDDELIEIQCASLSAIRAKAKRLLQRHSLRIVKPIVHRTRIVRMTEPGGEVTSRRMSPKRGSIIDVFDELIYFTRLFPHPNLVIEVPLIDVTQIRVPVTKRRKRRWQKDYTVHDVVLESIVERYELRSGKDLLKIIDWPRGKTPIQTDTIAKNIDRPRWVAQKIAYVLKHVGAIEATGRTRAGILYAAA